MNFIHKLFRKIYRITISILLYIEKKLSLLRSALRFLPLLLKKREKYRIVKTEELNPFLLYRRVGVEEVLPYPKIHRLTTGGELKIKSKGHDLYVFNNASFILNSDFIRFNDGSSFCEKNNRVEAKFTRCGDIDLVRLDEKFYELLKYKKKLYFDNVFHMSAAFSSVWSHFLVQCFPRLELIKILPKTESITIVLPKNVDLHILELTERVLNEYPEFKIFLCSSDTEIVCKKLYYVSTDTYLGDLGLFSSPFHTQITTTSVKYIIEKSLLIQEVNNNKNKIRLFIGREGNRNIVNYEEVLNYFKKLNFIEVFPHKLSLKQKAEIFSRAEYITGPGSSGFTNVIFCPEGSKVLALINPARHKDIYMAQIAKIKKIEFEYLLGNQMSSDLDSDFIVNIDEIKEYVKTYWNL